jgi:hypothetical protein
MGSDTLHVDDTPVPVLAPGTGKTIRPAKSPICCPGTGNPQSRTAPPRDRASSPSGYSGSAAIAAPGSRRSDNRDCRIRDGRVD